MGIIQKKPISRATDDTCPACKSALILEREFELYEQHGIPVLEKKRICSLCKSRITDIYMLRHIGRRMISEDNEFTVEI